MPGERVGRLARRHRLLPQGRTDDLPAIADGLVGLHSTDPVTVYLSACARMRRPSLEAVGAALYDDRSLIRHHAMRRTLWVATPSVVRLMHAAATRKLAGPEHRRTAKMLVENGVDDPETWLNDARQQVLATLHEHGSMNARELGDLVPELRHPLVLAPGKPYEATISAHTRVLLCLGFEGAILRGKPGGTWVNGAYSYAAADSWLPGGLGELDERESAGLLADRWLRAFGPGTAKDLQWWMGWTVALTKHALSDCGAVEVRLADDRPAYLAAGDEAEVDPAGPWVAVLPGLDPTTMGWKEREWYLPAHASRAFDHMGNGGPTIWVDGEIVGVWDQAPDGDLRTHFFVDVPASRREEVDQHLARVAALIGEARVPVRFPSTVSTAIRNGTPPPG